MGTHASLRNQRAAPLLFLLAGPLLVLMSGLSSPRAALAQGEAIGTKEVVLDTLADFNHTNASLIRLWKANERVQENGADPIGYFHDKADLSDQKLVLTSETNGYIAKITTQQRPTPNTYMPPELGELRLAGWKILDSDGVRITSDAKLKPDAWNDWAKRTPNPETLFEGVSLPVGGMNYILQGFKVEKTGLLSKLRIKIRRHPAPPSAGALPGISVAILANDPVAGNTRPKTYLQGGQMKEVVLGFAYVPDSKIGGSISVDGTHPFSTLDVVFRDIERPMLVADKLYWMKISTMPYAR